MLLYAKIASVVICVFATTAAAFAVTDAALKSAHCPVSGQDVTAEAHSDYKKGEVYFCCEKCKAAFDKDNAKFVTKANMQLAATGQYKQQACPITGNKLNPDTAVKVGDTKVAFCCNNCKGKAESMSDEERVAKLFDEKSFEKGKFVKVEEKK